MSTPVRPLPVSAVSPVAPASVYGSSARRRLDGVLDASALLGATIMTQAVASELLLQHAVGLPADLDQALESGSDNADLSMQSEEFDGLFGSNLLSPGLSPVLGLGAAVVGFPSSSAEIPAISSSSAPDSTAAPADDAGIVAGSARTVRQGGTPGTDTDGRPDPQREVQGTQEAGAQASDMVVNSGSGDPFGPAFAEAQNQANARADEAMRQSSGLDEQVPASSPPVSSTAAKPSGELSVMAW